MLGSTCLYSSKAETLQYFQGQIKTACILPVFCFSVCDWKNSAKQVLEQLVQQAWSQEALIVRSSALGEDSLQNSNAGHYLSLSGVLWHDLPASIDQVIASYASDSMQDLVLIQPCLTDLALSGVLFSHEPSTGAPYIVINYDDKSGSTDTVTSGSTNALRTRLIHRSRMPHQVKAPFVGLIALLQELETHCPEQPLDLEFAVDTAGQLYLFQVRPLLCALIDPQKHYAQLNRLEHFLVQHMTPHPYLFGERTILGIMPDWNPAEIIGVRPRPLARTLYQELVTDSIWAYQRDNYGYQNLRSFPLMISLVGCPYIDVRVSFNSFLPADLPAELARKLLDYYLLALMNSPASHDKVEFEIIFSCYTLDLSQRLQRLVDAGCTERDIDTLVHSLRRLTNRILHKETGLWNQDIAKIKVLDQRWNLIRDSELPLLARIYWLLEDCKRYGTLPFAGLARAGFIAVQILHSLVNLRILSPQEYQVFMQSLDTVSSRLQEDLRNLNRTDFLERYGHLRPGTYDILSYRYDEKPELYFSEDLHETPQLNKPHFELNHGQLSAIQALLRKHQLDLDVLDLFVFIKGAIEGREYAKFMFSRHLSEVMRLLEPWAQQYGMKREDLSFLDIKTIQKMYAEVCDREHVVKTSIEQGKKEYAETSTMVLPPLLTSPEDIWQFELQADTPNFITLQKSSGKVLVAPEKGIHLKGAIVLIPQADPGYDWLFSHQIGGLITQFGGQNSHMAIRAGELGIPAVIGAGLVLFQRWKTAQVLELDCANKWVRILL